MKRFLTLGGEEAGSQVYTVGKQITSQIRTMVLTTWRSGQEHTQCCYDNDVMVNIPP